MRNEDKTREEILQELKSLRSRLAEMERLEVERRQAEEALGESEAKYRELVQNANSIILRFDTQGRITFFNEFAQRFFGYPEEEILGQNVVGTIVPETDTSGHDLAEMIKDLLRHPEHYINNENENTRRNRERVWVAWTNKAVLDADGRIAEILAIGNDITKRMRVEEALITTKARLQHLLSSSPAVIYSYEGFGKGKTTFISENVKTHHGYKPQEFLDDSKFWRNHIHPEDEPRVLSEQSLVFERGHHTSEYRFQHKDGTYRWIREEERLAPDPQGNPLEVVGYWIDITERKGLEAQLVWSQKMETVGRLAGGVAHDFNNLLTTIKGYAELGMMRLHPNDRIHTDLQEILRASERAARLTKQLLVFSRKQIIEPQVISLNHVLLDTDRMLRRLIGEDIELVTLLAEDVGRVKVDRGQMEQVLVNLTVNARDAMPEGGKLTIEATNVTLDEDYAARHVGVAPGEYVMLSVTDTGVGITEDVKPHLFEPFFTTKELGRGTGLGLATCYGIVKQSGGNIWVYSEPGHGTTFKIYLPRVEGEARALPKGDENSRLPEGTEAVLLVEDEHSVRDVAARTLREQKYTVLEAATGEEALRVAEKHGEEGIHLLLTDVVMPKMGGKELAKRVKAKLPDIKVLFFSGYTDSAIIHHGVLDRGVAFLDKPFSPAELAQKVREVLDR